MNTVVNFSSVMSLLLSERSKTKNRLISKPVSAWRKSSPAAIFSAKTVFHCTCGAGVKNCKETLLRKVSGPTAHVAGAGLKIGGLRPSDTSQGVYLQSGARQAYPVWLLLCRIHFLLYSEFVERKPGNQKRKKNTAVINASHSSLCDSLNHIREPRQAGNQPDDRDNQICLFHDNSPPF